MTRIVAAVVVLAFALASCGSGEASTVDVLAVTDRAGLAESGSAPDAATGSGSELPTIVVTTNVLGDVVSEVLGDAAEVITIIPFGADPHNFQPSARAIDQLMRADALIVNGGQYEEGFLDIIEAATEDGVPTFEALAAVSTIEYGDEHGDEVHDEHGDEVHDEHGDEVHDEHGDEVHDEHGDDEHGDEVHDEHGDDEHAHDHHSGEDPHFFTDPVRMAAAVDGIASFLQDTVDFAQPDEVAASVDSYLELLSTLNADVAEMVVGLSDDQRVLVTNHQVFGYFADRYDFEVIGAVIPSGTTLDTTSGGELAELAELIDSEGVGAIFSDASASDELIQTLAAEVGDVAVVALYTESLGEPGSEGGSYLDMVRTNAQRIVGALG